MNSFIKKYEQRKKKILNWEKKMQEEDWITEAVEFLSPKQIGSDLKFSGRTTGSLQWRTSRGETAKNIEAKVVFFIQRAFSKILLDCGSKGRIAGIRFFLQLRKRYVFIQR